MASREGKRKRDVYKIVSTCQVISLLAIIQEEKEEIPKSDDVAVSACLAVSPVRTLNGILISTAEAEE